MLIPSVLNLIPLTTLAAVLLLVGYKLCHPKVFKEQWKAGPTQLVLFVVTIVAIIATDLLLGIAIGMVLAMALNGRKYRSGAIVVESKETLTAIQIKGHTTFLHKFSLQKILRELPQEKAVTVHTSGAWEIHPDIDAMLSDFAQSAQDRNIRVTLAHRKA